MKRNQFALKDEKNKNIDIIQEGAILINENNIVNNSH